LGKDEKLKLDKAMDIARKREATVNDMKSLEQHDASAQAVKPTLMLSDKIKTPVWKMWA